MKFANLFMLIFSHVRLNNSVMETIIELIQNNPYFGVVTAVIALASAIAAITPTPKDGSILAKAYNLIDLIALNIGKAKDKGDPK